MTHTTDNQTAAMIEDIVAHLEVAETATTVKIAEATGNELRFVIAAVEEAERRGLVHNPGGKRGIWAAGPPPTTTPADEPVRVGAVVNLARLHQAFKTLELTVDSIECWYDPNPDLDIVAVQFNGDHIALEVYNDGSIVTIEVPCPGKPFTCGTVYVDRADVATIAAAYRHLNDTDGGTTDVVVTPTANYLFVTAFGDDRYTVQIPRVEWPTTWTRARIAGVVRTAAVALTSVAGLVVAAAAARRYRTGKGTR